MLNQPRDKICHLSEQSGLVRSSTGMVVDPKPFDHRSYDTVIVSGGPSVIEVAPAGLLAFMHKAAKRSRRVAAICTGAFLLAQAGLVDGRRATTHWRHALDLQTRFPKVKMDEDRIFLIDGNVWTSAGMAGNPPC